MGRNNLEIMQDKKIAIVDCNNFYVSCERLFNPSLKEKPVAVLSNNDGCIIARSQEVKDLGVKMGNPVFKLEKDINENIIKFSSNYVLYGDISDRISNHLRKYTNKLEIYSIDESFLDLSHVKTEDLITYIKNIKQEIYRLTGIPVSIGVAPNKTLAKLMNFLSKTKKELGGVASYWDSHNIDGIEIDEVWGIGRKWKKKLETIGVETIAQFKQLPDYHVRAMFTIVGLRTWMELNGKYVHDIQTKFKKPKVVTSSRSFGRTVWHKDQLKDAIWTFLEDITSKLKIEKLNCREVFVFFTTNRFEDNYTTWTKSIKLWNPENDTQSIWNEVAKYLEEVPMTLWARAGVIAYSLIDDNVVLNKLFDDSEKGEFAKPEVKSQMWMTRRDFISQKFTTDWSQIPVIK